MLRLATRPTGSPPACWSAAFGPAARTKVADALLDYGAGWSRPSSSCCLTAPYDRRSIHRPLNKGESISVLETPSSAANEGKTMRPRRDARRCKLGEVFDGGRSG
jgi:hypothetical protein